jgi:hypothetical protein
MLKRKTMTIMSNVMRAVLVSLVIAGAPASASASDSESNMQTEYSHCDMYRDMCIITGERFWCDGYIYWCWLV